MNRESWLFILFVLMMAAAFVGLTARCIGSRSASILSTGLVIWFAYVVALSHFGVLQRSDARPPGMLFVLAPAILFLLVTVGFLFTTRGEKMSSAFPLVIVIGLQAFRIVVELFIHQLWADGIVPRMLTFSGANIDIYIGLSAPIIALFILRGYSGRAVILFWNGFGLLALANVVTRAILTVPGPLNLIHAEMPNRMFGTFPFMFIPAFFVPLAVTLHLIAIRAVSKRRLT